VLFNGGVFKAEPLRQRLLGILKRWTKAAGAPPVKELHGTTWTWRWRAGAYYGLVRRGHGVRIRRHRPGYYVGVESSLPGCPAVRRRSSAVRGAVRMEEGPRRRAGPGVRPGGR